MFFQLGKGISKAVLRFPLTVISLVVAAGLVCYLINLEMYPAPLYIEKYIFTLAVGAFIGMLAQFLSERFPRLGNRQQTSESSAKGRLTLYGLSVLLTAGYFLILFPAPEISNEVIVRSLVTIFALFCGVLFVPSFRKTADFNKIALIHFKSLFTSGLYSGVIAAGFSAILVTIDLLLFPINEKSYAYMMAIIWIVFAPVYFLSLLPLFNATGKEEQEITLRKSDYPKFLEILVSYIAIPLFSVYTLVLLAYFVKILVSWEWPSGQLGPMILAYSAVGIVLFILGALLENRFAYWFRMIFPKALIPVVIMQMVAVWIRLDAYGITESRYYIALFGIFSIVSGVILSIWPNGKNGIVVLLSTAVAIFSVLPPVDAFTVSRNSQIGILEDYLQSEGILSEGVLTPDSDVPEKVRVEITGKLEYLSRTSSLEYIKWLPEDFDLYQDFETTFGFEPTYSYTSDMESQYFHTNLDTLQPLSISGYDIAWLLESGRYSPGTPESYDFNLNMKSYSFRVEVLSTTDLRVSVTDENGTELIGTNFYDFAQELKSGLTSPKDLVSPEEMTLGYENDGYRLKVIFQWIDMVNNTLDDESVTYSAYVFFDAPE